MKPTTYFLDTENNVVFQSWSFGVGRNTLNFHSKNLDRVLTFVEHCRCKQIYGFYRDNVWVQDQLSVEVDVPYCCSNCSDGCVYYELYQLQVRQLQITIIVSLINLSAFKQSFTTEILCQNNLLLHILYLQPITTVL